LPGPIDKNLLQQRSGSRVPQIWSQELHLPMLRSCTRPETNSQPCEAENPSAWQLTSIACIGCSSIVVAIVILALGNVRQEALWIVPWRMRKMSAIIEVLVAGLLMVCLLQP
jgi:hypothetical protein